MNEPQTAPRFPAGTKPEPGLHMVSTPIGAARDITLKALDILSSVDVLAAEDTRTLRHLMEIHGIAVSGRPMIAYHDHNGDSARPRILAALAEGKSVAYASEAGTPMVADPGMKLAREAISAGYRVLSAPGASALLAALAVAGLPTDRFLFAGFPPAASGARQSWIRALVNVQATLVLYESPRRVGRTLGELARELGDERQAALCRELTKRFEEVVRGTLGQLAVRFEGQELKGEVVLVIDRPLDQPVSDVDLEQALREALSHPGARVKDASNEIAERFGVPKRDVYQMALKLGKGD